MDWAAVPRLVHPMGGCLPEKRLLKKCQQLESMAREVVKIAEGEQKTSGLKYNYIYSVIHLLVVDLLCVLF